MDNVHLGMPQASSGESASDALAVIALVSSRARDIQKRVWLLPLALGVTAILAASFYSKAFTLRCWENAGGISKAVSCTPTYSGVTVIPTGILPRPGSTYTFVGKPRFEWSLGTSPWFWVIGIMLSVLLSLAVLKPRKRTTKIYVTHALAIPTGSSVILLRSQLGLPTQIACLLGVCITCCVIALALHSRWLAAVAFMSFFAGAILTRNSFLLVPHLNIWLAPPSQGYVAAGIVLICGSAVLSVRTTRLTPKIRRLYNHE